MKGGVQLKFKRLVAGKTRENVQENIEKIQKKEKKSEIHIKTKLLDA